MPALYDRIGAGYTSTRREDPRIAARILDALGDARSVLNVGAGAGSYEPTDRPVVALEPSLAMIAQRPHPMASTRLRPRARDRAPVVTNLGVKPPAHRSIQSPIQNPRSNIVPPASEGPVRGVAAHLPFRDNSFDAAMAILTIHHWPDWRAGIAEMRRVSRQRLVILTFDPRVSHSFWLVDEYLPGIRNVATDAFDLAEVATFVGGQVGPVPVPADCTDGFLAAFWRRPERYLEPAIQAGISAFHNLPGTDLESGLARLRADLATGAWQARHADLLSLSEFDGGYRLLIADH